MGMSVAYEGRDMQDTEKDARERDVRVIEVKQSVFASNDRAADALRDELRARKTFLLNLMSSPGSGKTTTLARTIEALAGDLSIGVMEADIDSDVDARAMAATGVTAIQLHTGGMCHLDAAMCRQGLAELEAAAEAAGTAPLDLAILENVGNLVCPAEFDTGASVNVAILSVPEGDDKPLKYPLMFEVCDVVLVNKMDVAPYFDFDLTRCEGNVHLRNPGAKVIPMSAKTGGGHRRVGGMAARRRRRVEDRQVREGHAGQQRGPALSRRVAADLHPYARARPSVSQIRLLRPNPEE